VNETQRERVLVNVGCGPRGSATLPSYFATWRQLRVDVDPTVAPDIIADLTDLTPIRDGTADAVWAAHCIEHLYEHQVLIALAEFRRVLRLDGFVCVIVPDLQAVAQYFVADQSHESLYQSPAGPVTPHDVFFGYGKAIASGRVSMAHRCGFTPGSLQRCFQRQPFGELVVRRRAADFELAAVARVTAAKDDAERVALLAALEL
jgi:SAM-dependent methyltransferase